MKIPPVVLDIAERTGLTAASAGLGYLLTVVTPLSAPWAVLAAAVIRFALAWLATAKKDTISPASLVSKPPTHTFPAVRPIPNVNGNHPTRKLGRRAPSNKPAIRFADHLAAVPTHPIVDLAPNLDYPMDGNDSWGDCVIAGTDHALQAIMTALTGSYTNWTTAQIIAYYKTQNPTFDPTTDVGDNGMDIQTWLEQAVKDKLILGFAKVDYTNADELRAATYLGLAVITGVNLDEAQQSPQFDQGTWDYVKGSPAEGGHCIPLVGYDKNGFPLVTWAKLITGTNAFVSHQMEEAWFIITQAHVDHPAFRAGYDLASFAAAYQEITGAPFPAVVPAPAPTPEPAPTPAASVVVDDPALVEKIEALAKENKETPHDYLAARLHKLWTSAKSGYEARHKA